MARIGAAHHRERRLAAAFDQARIEPRHFRCSAHVEIEVAAPELLDAFDGLARLEAGFDDLEIVPLVGAGALGDLVDDRGQVGMKHAKSHRIGSGGARNAGRGDQRRGGQQKSSAIDPVIAGLPDRADSLVRRSSPVVLVAAEPAHDLGQLAAQRVRLRANCGRAGAPCRPSRTGRRGPAMAS